MSTTTAPGSSTPTAGGGMITVIQISVMTPTPTSQTSDAPSATATVGASGPMKPVQSYLYPSIALVLFVLLTIHMCRFLERRRMVRRGRQMTPPREGSLEYTYLEGGGGVEVSKPVMYTVEVEPSHAQLTSWDGIMPLSATILNSTTAPTPPLRTQRTIAENLIRGGFLQTHQRLPPPPPPPPSPPRPPALLTGVVIAMPNPPSYRHRHDDLPPEVVLGYKETTLEEPST